MKKIKSKLVYINPQFKTTHKIQKSPSPDYKNGSKIKKTQSPVKQVQQYCKIKQKISHYCSEIQSEERKEKIKYFQSRRKDNYESKQSSAFNVKDSYNNNFIDTDSISQDIKLKSPSVQDKTSKHNQLNNKYFSSMGSFHTPKSKNYTQKRQQFPVGSIQWKSNSQHSKYNKQCLSSLGIQNTAKISRNLNFDSQGFGSQASGEARHTFSNTNKESKSKSNKKNKRKLQIHSPSSSFDKNGKNAISTYSNNDKKYASHSKFASHQNQNHGAHYLSSFYAQQEVSSLRQQLLRKQQQLNQMSQCMSQYQKLGDKNKKMEIQMKKVLNVLVGMKQKQKSNRNVEKNSISKEESRYAYEDGDQSYVCNEAITSYHNGDGQSHDYTYDQSNESDPQQQSNDFQQHNSERQQSQIYQQNIHSYSHKRSLTDDYIKIYDQTQSSKNSSIYNSSINHSQQQEQSYKLNMENGWKEEKRNKNDKNINKEGNNYCHRKMLSVGARLKQSLKSKNEDFKASFDQASILSSFSTIISQPKAPSDQHHSVKPQQNHTKMRQNHYLQTQQTQQEDSLQQQHQLFKQQESSLYLYQNNNNQSVGVLLQKGKLLGSSLLDQGQFEQYQQSKNEQTTVKKPTTKSTMKYIIKRKSTQNNILSTENVDSLIQTNKQLAQIVNKLVGNNQVLSGELTRMSQMNDIVVARLQFLGSQVKELGEDVREVGKVERNKGSMNYQNGPNEQVKGLLKGVEQKVNKVLKYLDQSTQKIKKQDSQNKIWLQNSRFSNSVPSLTKIASFGLNNQKNKLQIFPTLSKQYKKSRRKQSINSGKQPGSPSFTCLQNQGSFLQQSFKLSHSDRSNVQGSKLSNNNQNQNNYNNDSNYDQRIRYNDLDVANVQKHKRQNYSNNAKKALKSDNSVNIFISQENSQSQRNSNDSNLLSNHSNGTSQFNRVQQQSIIRNEQKSLSSKSKNMLRSQDSEVRINFDDLYEDVGGNRKHVNFELFKKTNTANEQSLVNVDMDSKEDFFMLMKSSFGPIMNNNQMSRSQKGQGNSVFGQSHDHMMQQSQQPVSNNHNNESPSKLYNRSRQQSINRQRQNSSINIFFSSDSICKTSKQNVNTLTPVNPLYTPIQHLSSNLAVPSFSCFNCSSLQQQTSRLQTQAFQMRKIINQLSQQRDSLKKLVKSKVEVIDRLQISLKQLQTVSNLQKQGSQGDNQAQENTNNQSKWYASVNDFKYASVNNNNNSNKTNRSNNYIHYHQQPSSIIAKKFQQIQDVLPITNLLKNQLPEDKIQSLMLIQHQIREQIRRQKQLESNRLRQFEEGRQMEGGLNQGNNQFQWGRGSFSKVEQMREQSFMKTKGILLKLIHLIRDFVSENGANSQRT